MKPLVGPSIDSAGYRTSIPGNKRPPSSIENQKPPALFERTPKLKQFYAEYAEERECLEMPPVGFALSVWRHIVRKSYTRKEFCEKTLLSEKMYERLRDDQVPRPSIETVMLICIGLDLGGVLGEQLLDLAEIRLTKERWGYRKVLYECRGASVYECDEILTTLGFPSILPKQIRTSEDS